MKILIIGLEGIHPVALFADERLSNMRQLMELGCYGRLDNPVLPDGFSVWQCLSASQIPSPDVSLNEQSGHMFSIWSHLQQKGQSVAHIESTSKLDELAGDTSQSLDQIYAESRDRFALARRYLQNQESDHLQIIEVGAEILQRLWADQFARLQDFPLFLDEQIGSLLEFLSEETVLLVLFIHRAHNTIESGFILASANNPLHAEIHGAGLLDIAPTLLQLIGEDIPISMQGKSLLAGIDLEQGSADGLSQDEEELLRERLSGLGYIN